MGSVRLVKEGDCINSIAFEAGFFPDTVWKAAENSELREQRQDMNVLMPGDSVTIPDKRERTEFRPVDKRHRFRRRGVPKILRFQFLDPDDPIANASYTFIVDDITREGTTDGAGWLIQPIPPNARHVVVRLHDYGDYEFELGAVDPHDETSGVIGRLFALGYHHGLASGVGGDDLRLAVTRFQRDNGLDATGEIDAALQSKLKELLGC